MLQHNHNLHKPAPFRYKDNYGALLAETVWLKNQFLILQLAHEEQKKDFLILSTELKTSLQVEKDNVSDLENMLQIISHKVRQPIAHILGLSSLLDSLKFSVEIRTMLDYLKNSASALDGYTRDLTKYIWHLVNKSKVK